MRLYGSRHVEHIDNGDPVGKALPELFCSLAGAAEPPLWTPAFAGETAAEAASQLEPPPSVIAAFMDRSSVLTTLP